MRAALLVFFILALAVAPAWSQAATVPGILPAAKSVALPAAPAIIPGSPLATLTGATASPPAANGPEPMPFGSGQLGFFISGAAGNQAVRAFHRFTGAVRASTNLTEISAWLHSLYNSPSRQEEAWAILQALLTIVLPAALLDAALRLALRRPARLCALWARPRSNERRPTPETPRQAAQAGRYVSLRAWLRRLAFALLKFALALLPLAAFIVTVQLCLSAGLAAQHGAVLAATSTANAYLFGRLAQEAGRFLLSPAAPPLRLFTMPTARAVLVMRGLLVIIATIFISWALLACAEILGLPHTGIEVLQRIAVLAVHLEAAVGIWRSRHVVGAWIAGGTSRTGTVDWLRALFGRWWHYAALFYVLALWVAWAGGVHNAFFVLLRAVLVVVITIIIARATWGACGIMLDRLFADPAQSRFPNLATRARAYSPLIGFLLRAAIGIAALFAVMQGWGLGALYWLHHNTISQALISALSSLFITTAIALGLWEAGNYTLSARIERLTATGRSRHATRLRTLAPILRAAAGTLIFAVALVAGLSQIGVNTTGLLAVSSIAGIAVGFGSQKLVQDIITGLFILLEDAVQVGDVVTLAGVSGTVERLSIRTIRLRASDGSVNIIPFSSVTIVTNATRDFSNAQLSITVSYHENVDRVCAVLTGIGHEMRAEPAWGAMMRDDLQIFGLDSFGDLGLVISAQIRTGPGQHYAVRREFYRRVQQRFAEQGIVIPLGQQRVFKLEMPPAAPEPPAKAL